MAEAVRPLAVIFDLDGTLVDSAAGIGAVLNGMRADSGAAPLPVQDYRRWVSLGADRLVANALGIDSSQASGPLVEFRRRYALETTDVSHLYPGVAAHLRTLRSQGALLGVCTNKPQALAQKVLRDVGLDDCFASVIGGDAVASSKPDPRHLLAVATALGSAPHDAVFVGDSRVDQACAAAAGVPFVFARYGYDDGVTAAAAARVVDSFADPLLDLAWFQEIAGR